MRSKIHKLWGTIGRELNQLKKASGLNIRIDFPDQSDIQIEKIIDRWKIGLQKPLKFSVPIKGKRNVSSSNHMDIYISGEIICSDNIVNGQAELISYNTEIAYYKNKGAFDPEYIVFDGYHFDMDEEIGIAHPVFHAQRKPNLMHGKIQEHFTGVNINTDNDDPFERNRNFRLPTPQLDLYSAILMLVANHAVTKNRQNEFIAFADKVTMNNPVRAILTKQGRLHECISNNEIAVNHWYAVAL